MAQNQEVSAKMKDTLDLAARCFEAEKSEGYEVLSEQLRELETLAQQTYRDHADCKSLVKKLDNGDPLTPGELDTLKLMIVGDAGYYVKYDDDFDRSKTELKRILDAIAQLQSSDLDVDGMMHVGVLCQEAYSVAKPATFYLQQKDRVRKFEEATRDGIGRESGKILADILRGL